MGRTKSELPKIKIMVVRIIDQYYKFKVVSREDRLEPIKPTTIPKKNWRTNFEYQTQIKTTEIVILSSGRRNSTII